MTDFTNVTSIPRKRSTSASHREYYAYFAVIFVATLPLAVLTWALTALRQLWATPCRPCLRECGRDRRKTLPCAV